MMPAGLTQALDACSKPWTGTRRLAVASGVAVAVATIGLLALSGWFITAAAIAGAAGPFGARAFNYLIPSALIRLLAIVRTTARYFERLLSHRASLSTLAAFRSLLFREAAMAEAQGTLKLSGGDAATLLVQDIDRLEDHLVRTPALAGAVAGAALTIALAALAGPWPPMLVAAALAGGAIWTRRLARHRLPRCASDVATAVHDLKGAVTEYAASAAEIAVYGLTDRVSARLESLANHHDEALRRQARMEAMVGAILPATAGIASALAIVTASAGPALAAMAALATAASGEALLGYVRAQVRAPSVDDASRRLATLTAIDVPDQPVLRLADADIAFSLGGEPECLSRGERVAVLGVSGAGKTRLLHTLAGLRTDAPQRPTIGDVPAGDLGLFRLRQLFALVPQDAMLIAGTVLDNLRLARPGLREDEIWNALHTACLDDEIRSLPEGLAQWIGEDGARLSGGQRKRLALARGLLAARPWLLLDEPSEGLDGATETELVKRLGDWFERTGQGLILVSHRPAMLGLAQRVLLLSA
ncbi:ATP-binding cassette domain-containing protein [Sphingomonas sp. RT2P30]|uniref:ATP-binding cassette domain-containing protein n=1 Tax=Parasphingomonas halimpatiens TaxID=3096162 RepID=UPI002FCB4AC1